MCQASVGIMPETSSPVPGAVLGTAISGHIQLGLHFKYSLLMTCYKNTGKLTGDTH